MKEILDNWTFSNDILYREKVYEFNGKTLKIIVDRNCNNYNANIKVVLVDLENVREITLLKYATESLKHKDLSCYSDDLCKQYEVLSKNDEDIEKVIKDVLKVVE